MSKIVVNGKRGTQARTLTTGWTKAKRQIFLDHLAATCNVTGAATAAGMSDRGAHLLRQRDPEFAELWREALVRRLDAIARRLRREGRVIGPDGSWTEPEGKG